MRYDDILRNSNIGFQVDLPRLPVPVVLSDPDFLMFAELSANLVQTYFLTSSGSGRQEYFLKLDFTVNFDFGETVQ